MMQPSPSPHQRGPPAYMAQMMGHPHMGYSPMAIHPVTPGYMHGKPMPQSSGRRSDVSRSASYMKAQQQQTPTLTTPRTPGVRLGFDPHSSKKKRKLSPGEKVSLRSETGSVFQKGKVFSIASLTPRFHLFCTPGARLSILWKESRAAENNGSRNLFVLVQRQRLQCRWSASSGPDCHWMTNSGSFRHFQAHSGQEVERLVYARE